MPSQETPASGRGLIPWSTSPAAAITYRLALVATVTAAVFEAFLNPEFARLETVSLDGATVRVWTGVDREAMQADYWAATKPQEPHSN